LRDAFSCHVAAGKVCGLIAACIRCNNYITTIFMSTDILQQEILLLTGTTFSQRQLSENDGGEDSHYLSESEKLEEACWTGLIDDLLPEIITNKELGISQFRDGEFSLQIELAEYPLEEKPFSINPSYFLTALGNN
jgi:hypothetical protein